MKQQSLKIFSKEETGPYELPKGWRWVRLGDKDLFHIETGSTPKTDVKEYWQNGNIKWITPKDLGKLTNKFIFDTERKITQDGLNSCSTTIIPKGSIIISTRAPIGHIAICGDEMCFNQGCKGIVIKNKNQVLNDFLYYVLLTKVKEMDALGSGATFKEISRKKLASIQIPLPPLPEQKRIVARIEALFSKIDEIKRLRKEANDLAKTLLPSALHEVFSKADEKGWRWVRLGEVCETLMGGTPRTNIKEYWSEPQIVWVTPEDIKKSILNKVRDSRRKISKKGLEESNAKLLPAGTVLLTTTATIGKVGIAEIDLTTNQQITGIICPKDMFPIFLGYYLLFVGEENLKKLGGAVTATHINQRNLRSIKIPLPFKDGKPDFDEQKHIVAYLDNIQQKAQTLQKLQEETEMEIERLRESILHKAFRGEL